MGYMGFKNPPLEKIFKRFKWTRNNTIEIFESAEKSGILNYTSSSKKSNKYIFQPLLFQFQCIVTTTDVYYRKLNGARKTQFGVLVKDGKTINKKDISYSEIETILNKQLQDLQSLLKDFDNNDIQDYIEEIMAISNHEYLHQGQMIVDFREAGVELPERFRKAWAL